MLHHADNHLATDPVALLLPPSVIDQMVAQVEARVSARMMASAKPAPPSPYMTVDEVAEHIRSGRQRVYDLLSSGRLPRYKDGTRVLVRRADVDLYLAGIGGAT